MSETASSQPFLSASEQRDLLGLAARQLAAAEDFTDTLRQALAVCLPALGDFGFFDVVMREGAEVRRTVAAHQAPHIEAMLAPTRWVRQEHPELNLCALSTGDPALHPDIGEPWYRAVAGDNEPHLRLLRELAFRSMISVPMRYRGEVVGALTLFMGASGRTHGPEHLEFAAQLASVAAPVVVHARLLEQHKGVAAQLDASAERLRMAVEAGRVGIWDWDIAGDAVTWSDRIYEMHGLPVGSDTGGVEGFRARVHPQDWPRVEQALRDALSGGPQYEVEFRTLLDDGSWRWIQTRSHLVRDAQGRPLRMVGASIDTTERMELLDAERRARAEAEAAQRRLEVLAAAGTRLAGSLDPEDTLKAIAESLVPGIVDWCRIDLLDEHGQLQRRLAHHVDGERARQALELARRVSAGPETEGSMSWALRTGQAWHGRFDEAPALDDPVLREYLDRFGMRTYFTLPLVARGRMIGVLRAVQAESGREITEADRALIQELAQRAALALDNANAYAQAEAARRQAETASHAKDEFLAMLGHELRNPLAPIATALELMARREAGVHVEERRIIGRQVAHLSRLIDDLLDVSRITQGKIELQRAPVDLRDVAAQALEQTRPLYDRRAHPVEVQLGEVPAHVHGDAVRLTQVVCNLLVNAAKFTPAEGRVRLTLRAGDAQHEVVVEDTGSGIAPQLLPRVFDLFVQGRQSLARQSGGLGLGLAIVRMLVEMHGGSVGAQSDGEGHGSQFYVRLPAGGAPAAGVTEPAGGQAASGTGVSLLIVDDNTDAAHTLGELLRLLGYEVRCADHADAARALLASWRPRLALLDIGLPGEDGYTLAAGLRADPRCAGMKLVALTGYGQEADRARALAAQFDEHLVKPVAMPRLLDVLQRLLAEPLAA